MSFNYKPSFTICFSAGLLAVAIMFTGSDVLACPACADNVAAVNGGTAKGFVASIIGLISLPLLLVGGITLAVIREKRSSVGILVSCALLVGSGVLAGCGGSESDDVLENRVPADMSMAVQVSGTVTFNGTPPAQEMIDVSADDYCGVRHEAGQILSDEVVVTDGKLANVFVYVSKGLEEYAFEIPTAPAKLDQKGCRYHPHVMGVIVGQTLEIHNSDSTIHNVHAMTKNNKAFNLGQGVGGSDTRSFEKEEVMIPVVCDVHGWMKSWVAVLHHPAFAVSGLDGSYAFLVPPGEYTLTAWHERFGTREETLIVEEGKPVLIDFAFD